MNSYIDDEIDILLHMLETIEHDHCSCDAMYGSSCTIHKDFRMFRERLRQTLTRLVYMYQQNAKSFNDNMNFHMTTPQMKFYSTELHPPAVRNEINKDKLKIEGIEYKHIEIKEDACNGDPVIKGTRIAVEVVQRFYHSGCNVEKIQKMYPHLETNAIAEALKFPLDQFHTLHKELKTHE